MVAKWALLPLLSVLFALSTASRLPPIPSQQAQHQKKQFDDLSAKYLTPDDFELAAKQPVARPTGADLDAVQNAALFEGDIEGIPPDSTPSFNQRLRDSPIGNYEDIFRQPFNSALNLATYPDKLWPDGVVPYMLEEGMTSQQRAAIAQAFDEYKQKTCIRFVPRSDDDFDYIYVKRNVAFGCSSYVGRAGGNQTVSLEVDKCFSKGIIAHELMHAIGFFHEHSRTDRDHYVDIVDDNIRPGMMRNFEKYPQKIIDPLGMPYDYDSVMHYHKLAFSKNGKSTIVPKEKGAEIGQRYKLSDIDSQKVNKLYKCGDFASTSSTTTTTTQSSSTTTTTPKEEVKEKKKSSSTTTTTTTTTTTRAKVTTPNGGSKSRGKCEDLNAHCVMWEQLGHCEHSLKYMSHYCRKACGFCDDDDQIEEELKKEKEEMERERLRKEQEENREKEKEKERLERLRKEKEEKERRSRERTTTPSTTTTTKSTTTKRPPFTYRPRGGGFGRGRWSTTRRPDNREKEREKSRVKPKLPNGEMCEDKNLFCSYWAKIGECSSESKFMKVFCKASCGKC
ncbi:unnamed protein product, partial [Mesorhabditis belari]|uniref:Metalloendopeptidase n=1 Tax=Mesorhabditis belari TaxID=2138241 RepID=A0AAF3EZ02_9BILA